jgi:hypothetical protein
MGKKKKMRGAVSYELISRLPDYVDTITNPNDWVQCADELLIVASMLEAPIQEEWGRFRANWKKLQDQYEGTDPLPIIPKNIQVPFRVPRLQGVYFMLVAYALENLFKAAIGP